MSGHPSFEIERNAIKDGYNTLAAMDEVGRGAWAGPLSVGVVVMDKNCILSKQDNENILKIRDSKELSSRTRFELADFIRNWTIDSAVAHATENELNKFGLSQSLRLAARRALESLKIKPELILYDGREPFFKGKTPSRSFIHGDQRSLLIASAAILAKTTRDLIMQDYAQNWPQYGFETNKGYGTKYHLAALNGWGPSYIHRINWSFMNKVIWSRSDPKYKNLQLD